MSLPEKEDFSIIPAIDLIGGQCVRLEKGQFDSSTVVHTDPLAAARMFFEQGFRRLHLVDLDGARLGQVQHLSVLQTLVRELPQLGIDFSGGIADDPTVEAVLATGVDLVTIGSLAVRNPAKVIEWAHRYGPDRFIVATDLKNGFVAIKGWLENSAKTIDQVMETLEPSGIDKLMCTAIDKDGMMEGPDFDLYVELRDKFPRFELIASGGVHSVSDIDRLKKARIDGCIVGKALYQNTLSPAELAPYLC
jgi:phosphoribosylformimino-5-aminoimidazole carboxamide ribotide isomerase